MKKKIILLSLLLVSNFAISQVWNNPAITSWIFNTTGQTGSYYNVNNGPLINHGIEVNVQQVSYNTTTGYSYVEATGVPAYDIGPYLDGNPDEAEDQSYTFRIPLSPTEQTGAKTPLGLGPQGVFINGVVVFNFADGRSYNNQGIWNQSAVYFENDGFDCAKGHPAQQGNYHHHQNPTAFDLDLVELSDICTNHDSDGLYVIDSNAHSPLIGFAKDGFPIYGAYAYANTDGSGGIKRMESSYQYASAGVGTRTNGPSYALYENGAYEEDFVFVNGSGDLDEHNGRFAITPEYPSGTYAYYATVDANHNSYYPYLIGPTFYGVVPGGQYGNSNVPNGSVVFDNNLLSTDSYLLQDNAIQVYPNPVNDFALLQVNDILKESLDVKLVDINGKLISEYDFVQGRTICTIDTSSLYNGTYFVVVSNGKATKTLKILVNKKF